MESKYSNLEIMQLFKEISNLCKTNIKDDSISPMEFLTIATIYNNDYIEKQKPLLAKEIANNIGVSNSSFSRILSNLEDKNLVSINIPTENKRTYELHLTDSAISTVKERFSKTFEGMNKVREKLGDDFDQLISSLYRIKDIIKEMGDM